MWQNVPDMDAIDGLWCSLYYCFNLHENFKIFIIKKWEKNTQKRQELKKLEMYFSLCSPLDGRYSSERVAVLTVCGTWHPSLACCGFSSSHCFLAGETRERVRRAQESEAA